MRRVFSAVIKPPYIRVRRALRTALFDRRYGVETEEEVSQADAGVRDPLSTRYQPAGVLNLRRSLPRRTVSSSDVFVDLGSGKGRVVLQAALHYPFRAVYGVELSESLHAVAAANLERVRPRLRCQDVHLLRADAREAGLPDTVTVAYVNNPFGGEVFEWVIDRLVASVDRNPRRLRIIYGVPLEESALLATGRVRLIGIGHGWRPGAEWSRSNSYRLYEVTPAP